MCSPISLNVVASVYQLTSLVSFRGRVLGSRRDWTVLTSPACAHAGSRSVTDLNNIEVGDANR